MSRYRRDFIRPKNSFSEVSTGTLVHIFGTFTLFVQQLDLNARAHSVLFAILRCSYSPRQSSSKDLAKAYHQWNARLFYSVLRCSHLLGTFTMVQPSGYITKNSDIKENTSEQPGKDRHIPLVNSEMRCNPAEYRCVCTGYNHHWLSRIHVHPLYFGAILNVPAGLRVR